MADAAIDFIPEQKRDFLRPRHFVKPTAERRIVRTKFTYKDYLSWDDECRYELIDGVAYMMSAPSVAHQAVSGELFAQFYNFLKGKPCRVFAAPFDVRLFPRDDLGDDTVVQPDLLVVCDEDKLDDGKSCKGAPSLVIEILSPSNSVADMIRKREKYFSAGVGEFWLIDPESRETDVYLAGEDGISFKNYTDDEPIPARVLPGFSADMRSVWLEASR